MAAELMCNRERLRSGPAEIRGYFDVLRELDGSGNLEPGDTFPRQSRPVIRRCEDGRREMVMMEWGFPYRKKDKATGKLALKKNGEPYAPSPTTNIRHPHYPMFRNYLAPDYRCLVPSNHFAEPNPAAKNDDEAPRDIWFALGEEFPLYAVAGLWRPWEGDRIKNRGNAETQVYGFLTTEPNELIEPIHPKAMPVILDPDDYETWLTAPWEDAKALQKPFPAEAMVIVDNPR